MITLTDSYLDSTKARAVPGSRWDPATRSWVVDVITPRTALVALRLFPKLALTAPELVAARDALAQNVRPADYARQWWEAGGIEQSPQWPNVLDAALRAGLEPVEFQLMDIGYLNAVLRKHNGAYLGWERGLGKTMAAIGLIEAVGAQRTLIITPNTSKYSVWEPQWRQLGEHLGFPWSILPNAKGKREQAMLWQLANRRGAQVLVMHYEQLDIVRQYLGRWAKLGEWDLVITDEAHHFANSRTKQSRALKTIPSAMRLAMSGSIIQNRADELFSPLQWLFPQRYSSKWRDWNDRLLDFVDIGHREYIGVKLEMLDTLRDELGRFMTYRRGDDELDLPPVTSETLPIQLSSRQRRVYDDLQRDAIAQIDAGEIISTANAVALLTRLRQIATGLSLVSAQVEDSTKLDTAVDIIRDNPDDAFVIFSWFVPAAEALARRLEAAGVGAFVITGNTPHKRRAEYIQRFQAGERRAFIGTIGTLGESHTLDRAAQVLFLDRAWNPALNEQSVDRVAGGFRRRQHIHVTNIVASDTVDETNVTNVLNDKAALRAMILGSNR